MNHSSVRVDYEAVSQAADALVKRGINPTQEKLRILLGGGSFTTISKYVRMWREHKEAQQVKGSELESSLPDLDLTPPDRVGAAVQEVWRGLMEEAQSNVRTIEERAALEAQHAAGEIEDLKSKMTFLLQKQHLMQQIFQYDKQQLLADNASLQQEVTKLSSVLSSALASQRQSQQYHHKLEQQMARTLSQADKRVHAMELENQHYLAQLSQGLADRDSALAETQAMRRQTREIQEAFLEKLTNSQQICIQLQQEMQQHKSTYQKHLQQLRGRLSAYSQKIILEKNRYLDLEATLQATRDGQSDAWRQIKHQENLFSRQHEILNHIQNEIATIRKSSMPDKKNTSSKI